eukprot:scaffold94896_cov69-Phaeocystis_antarctica.AAC.1
MSSTFRRRAQPLPIGAPSSCRDWAASLASSAEAAAAVAAAAAAATTVAVAAAAPVRVNRPPSLRVGRGCSKEQYKKSLEKEQCKKALSDAQ